MIPRSFRVVSTEFLLWMQDRWMEFVHCIDKWWTNVTFYVALYVFCLCSEEIRNDWDSKKTVEQNLKDMGLSANPNITIPIPKAKVRIIYLFVCSLRIFRAIACSCLLAFMHTSKCLPSAVPNNTF